MATTPARLSEPMDASSSPAIFFVMAPVTKTFTTPCWAARSWMSLLLTGGRVIDPANRLDAVVDLLILNGKIAAVGKDAATQAPGEIERFDAKGNIVCPGLID